MAGPRIAPSLAGYIPPGPGSGPQVVPRRGILDELENLSYGIGQGQVAQLEGLKALFTQPAQTITGLYRAATNPRQTIAAMAADTMQKARGGPIGVGQLVGEMLSPRSLLGVNAATQALRKPGLLEIDVYHGTPHQFSPTESNPLGEFDASKIGTGEGAQVYGHGVYLAQRRGVAQSYKDNLAIDPRDDINDLIRKMAPDGRITKEAVASALEGHPRLAELAKSDPNLARDVYEATQGWDARSDTMSDAGIRAARRLDQRLPKGAGSLYTADLPDEMVDRMLDWDKPLSEQPHIMDAYGLPSRDFGAEEAMLEKARRMGVSPTALPEYQQLEQLLDESLKYREMTGAEFYRQLIQQKRDWAIAAQKEALTTLPASQSLASQDLASFGIPGIKYFDAGSRGKDGIGTRNFVVFPGQEKRVRILKRE